MENTSLTRQALVNSFPTSFSYKALTEHFSNEYLKHVGSSADDKCLDTLVTTFLSAWKKIKKRELFLTTPRGKAWLEKELPVSSNAKPKSASFAGRKTFEELSDRGKRGRVISLFTRTPEVDELDYLYSRTIKKRRLMRDCQAKEQRKNDNDILLLVFDAILILYSYLSLLKINK